MISHITDCRKVEVETTIPPDLGTLELRARLDALRFSIADLAELYGPEAEHSRWVLEEHERALRRELVRRVRLYRAGAGVPNPYDARHQQWLDLAARVRERADIVQVFADAGHDVADTRGWNARRQAKEFAGPCPWCGGRNRFRVWSGANSGYWCRGCHKFGDAITAVRNLIPGCRDFYPAVAYLARMVGLPLPPDPLTQPARRVVRLTPVEARHAG